MMEPPSPPSGAELACRPHLGGLHHSLSCGLDLGLDHHGRHHGNDGPEVLHHQPHHWGDSECGLACPALLKCLSDLTPSSLLSREDSALEPVTPGCGMSPSLCPPPGAPLPPPPRAPVAAPLPDLRLKAIRTSLLKRACSDVAAPGTPTATSGTCDPKSTDLQHGPSSLAVAGLQQRPDAPHGDDGDGACPPPSTPNCAKLAADLTRYQTGVQYIAGDVPAYVADPPSSTSSAPIPVLAPGSGSATGSVAGPATPTASAAPLPAVSSFPDQLHAALKAATAAGNGSCSDEGEDGDGDDDMEDDGTATAMPPPWQLARRPFTPGFHGPITVHERCPAAMRRQVWSLTDFSDLELLYRGYKSQVYQAMCRSSQQLVVLKVYQLSTLNAFHKHLVLREHSIHSRLDHPNIITLYASFQEDDNIVLVLEHATHGDLYGALRSTGTTLTEPQAVAVLRPVLAALQYCHTQGLVHRDLKPENILIAADGTFKLADFGVSIDSRLERPVTRAGTLDYMSPEVLRCPNKVLPTDNKDRTDLAYGPGTDVWALGVLGFELMTGMSPFLAVSVELCEQNVMYAQPAYPHKLSAAAVSFLEACMHKNEMCRPTTLELGQHPWLRSGGGVRRRSAAKHTAQGAGPAADAAAAAPASAMEASQVQLR